MDDEGHETVTIAIRNQKLLPRFEVGATWDVFLEPEITDEDRAARFKEWEKRGPKT